MCLNGYFGACSDKRICESREDCLLVECGNCRDIFLPLHSCVCIQLPMHSSLVYSSLDSYILYRVGISKTEIN